MKTTITESDKITLKHTGFSVFKPTVFLLLDKPGLIIVYLNSGNCDFKHEIACMDSHDAMLTVSLKQLGNILSEAAALLTSLLQFHFLIRD